MKLKQEGKIINGNNFYYTNFITRLWQIDNKENLYHYFKEAFSLYKVRYNNGDYTEAFMILISLIEDKITMLIILELKRYSKIGELEEIYRKLESSDVFNKDTLKKLSFMLDDDRSLIYWLEGESLTRKLTTLGNLNFKGKCILLKHFDILSDYFLDFHIIGNYRNNLAHNLFLNLSNTTKENIDDTMKLYRVLESELNNKIKLLK